MARSVKWNCENLMTNKTRPFPPSQLGNADVRNGNLRILWTNNQISTLS